ncbi:MAG: hypothetical protein J7J92_01460 [Candidatus Aenigmarchaeota archaeon]|nr:hypothetical protein [Candidatus Aenigmarchaeota archaeon]
MSKIPEYYEDTAKLIKRGENDLSPEEMLKLIYTKQYLILDKNPHNILIEAIETIEKKIFYKHFKTSERNGKRNKNKSWAIVRRCNKNAQSFF